MERPSDDCRRHHALPRQCHSGLHRTGAGFNGAGALLGNARTVGRPRCDGLSFLPAEPADSDGIGHGQGLEQAYLQTDQGTGRRLLRLAGRRARTLPGCGRIRHHGTVLEQDGDRADRVALDHLRRLIAGDRAERRQRLYP